MLKTSWCFTKGLASFLGWERIWPPLKIKLPATKHLSIKKKFTYGQFQTKSRWRNFPRLALSHWTIALTREFHMKFPAMNAAWKIIALHADWPHNHPRQTLGPHQNCPKYPASSHPRLRSKLKWQVFSVEIHKLRTPMLVRHFVLKSAHAW